MSFNYECDINTQGGRGIVARPDSPRIATTDFFGRIAASYGYEGKTTFSAHALTLPERSADAGHEFVLSGVQRLSA